MLLHTLLLSNTFFRRAVAVACIALAMSLLLLPAVDAVTQSYSVGSSVAQLAWSEYSGGRLYGTAIDNGNIIYLDIATMNIITFAGNSGYGYANGVGLAAQFYYPAGVAVHCESRRIFIADQGNNCIRVIDETTATVTTFAGDNVLQSAGTVDGVSTAARFNNPNSLAIHTNQLFVADQGNCCVRQISLYTGYVSTIAGKCGECAAPSVAITGRASLSRFNTLSGVAIGEGGTAVYLLELDLMRNNNAVYVLRYGYVSMVHQYYSGNSYFANSIYTNPDTGELYVAYGQYTSLLQTPLINGVVDQQVSTDLWGANAVLTSPTGQLFGSKGTNIYVDLAPLIPPSNWTVYCTEVAAASASTLCNPTARMAKTSR